MCHDSGTQAGDIKTHESVARSFSPLQTECDLGLKGQFYRSLIN